MTALLAIATLAIGGPAIAAPAVEPPSRLSKPSATALSASEIEVRWKAPRSDGGKAVARYQVRVYKGTKLIDIETVKASKRALSIAELKAGTKYTVSVRAKNVAGWSTSSSKDTVRTLTENQSAVVEAAKSYLTMGGWSPSLMMEQLEFDFSAKLSRFAVNHIKPTTNWKVEAAQSAQEYVDQRTGLGLPRFSRQELIDQLLSVGFSSKQAQFGVSAVGY